MFMNYVDICVIYRVVNWQERNEMKHIAHLGQLNSKFGILEVLV